MLESRGAFRGAFFEKPTSLKQKVTIVTQKKAMICQTPPKKPSWKRPCSNATEKIKTDFNN